MFDTIYAAEMQFRHESDERARHSALLASIRERRAAEATLALANVAGSRVAPPAQPQLAESPSTRVAWPRPIGIKDYATIACAAA